MASLPLEVYQHSSYVLASVTLTTQNVIPIRATASNSMGGRRAYIEAKDFSASH